MSEVQWTPWAVRVRSWLLPYRMFLTILVVGAIGGLFLASVPTEFWDAPLARPKLLQATGIMIGLLWYVFVSPSQVRDGLE